MRGLSLSFVAGLTIGWIVHVSAAPTQKDGIVNSDYFAQSERRDATPREAASLGRFIRPEVRDGVPLQISCSGYFLRNRYGLTYFATAKHCALGGDMEKACSAKAGEEGSFSVVTSRGETGRCGGVLLEQGDLSILWVNFPGRGPRGLRPLRIGAFAPSVDARMQLRGFPVDRSQQIVAAISENCWALARPVSRSFAGLPNWFDEPGLQWVRHNCTSVYGNSGGPFVLEGTDLVIGTQHIAIEGNPETPRAWDEGDDHFVTWQSVVQKYRAELEYLGMIIVDQEPSS